MAKQAKTKRREKYKSKAMQRVVKNMNGARNILKFLSRAESNDIGSVVYNEMAVGYLQAMKGNF